MIRNRKVLIVDTDLRVVRSLIKGLRRLGLEIVIARDGLEALDILNERPLPGLVIAGLNLPHINGVELANLATNADIDTHFAILDRCPQYSDMRGVKFFDRAAGVSHVVDYVARIAYRAA